MAYNPNEVLRLKHLNEFARQLRIKLDGETDPKIEHSIIRVAIGITGGTFIRQAPVTFDQPNVLNYPLSKLTSPNLRLYTTSLDFATMPSKITMLQSTPNIDITGFSWVLSDTATYISVKLDEIKVQSFDFTVIIPEDNIYQAMVIPIIFNVVED